MATPSSRNFKDIEAKVIAKASKDPSFKKKLLSNPKQALQEMGISLPENVTVKCIEDTQNTFTIVIPASSAQGKLSESELSNIAGGGGQNLSNPPGSCEHHIGQ